MIIIVDLAVKMYNDKMVKKDIEAKMQKEVSKDMTMGQDYSSEPNSYKNINIRNGQLVVFTSYLYMDAVMCTFIVGLFITQLIL